MASIDETQFAAAMQVLQREQQALLPSPVQVLGFRLFNVAVGLLVTLLALSALSEAGRAPRFVVGWVESVFDPAYGILAVAVVLLLLANAPLMWRLAKQERLRRRLGVERALRAAFWRRERSFREWVLPVLTLGSLVFVAWMFVSKVVIGGDLLLGLTTLIAVAALVSAGLMRWGRARLAVVQRLQRDLGLEEMGAGGAKGGLVSGDPGSPSTPSAGAGEPEPREISSAARSAIAELERYQIMKERLRSLREAPEGGRIEGYTVQQSREVLEAKETLDPSIRSRVESQIFQLMEDPAPAGAVEDETSGLSRLAIRGTGLEIAYEVEEGAGRIKIFYLTPAKPGDEGDRGDG